VGTFVWVVDYGEKLFSGTEGDDNQKTPARNPADSGEWSRAAKRRLIGLTSFSNDLVAKKNELGANAPGGLSRDRSVGLNRKERAGQPSTL